MYACVYIPELADEQIPALRACAEAFSPNLEFSRQCVVIDIRGLRRLYGSPESIGAAIAQRVSGMGAHVGVAANPQAATAAARGFSGLTVIPPGEEAAVLSSLPLDLLSPETGMGRTFSKWGIRTFADLAALPENGVSDRLGQEGVRLLQLARGRQTQPHVPTQKEQVIEAGMDLDYGLELLEPLLFILSRLLNEICGALAKLALAANELTVILTLENQREYRRTMSIPFATREAQTFLKLLQYDLAAHPPGLPVVAVYLRATPVGQRVVQGGLFVPLAPEPEKLELTLARILAIVGEGRVGTPELIDTHRPDAFRMARFEVKPAEDPGSVTCVDPWLAIRLYRPPLPADVAAPRGYPARIRSRGVNGTVATYAGPWRTSGDWFTSDPWNYDEWDVALHEGGLYRLRQVPPAKWFVEGVYD